MDKFWKQITPSEFSWEREALEFAKQALPDHEPYRAWANFEFIALDGSINEIDLMVLTPKGLFLVEIKSHPGVISGDAGAWLWESPDGKRKVLDNPRILLDRKAKKLASLLKVQPAAKQGKERIPFINTLVFLSADNLINKLQGPARMQITTRANFIDELVRFDDDWRHQRINRPIAKMLSRAVEQAGINRFISIRAHGLCEIFPNIFGAFHLEEALDQGFAFLD